MTVRRTSARPPQLPILEKTIDVEKADAPLSLRDVPRDHPLHTFVSKVHRAARKHQDPRAPKPKIRVHIVQPSMNKADSKTHGIEVRRAVELMVGRRLGVDVELHFDRFPAAPPSDPGQIDRLLGKMDLDAKLGSGAISMGEIGQLGALQLSVFLEHMRRDVAFVRESIESRPAVDFNLVDFSLGLSIRRFALDTWDQILTLPEDAPIRAALAERIQVARLGPEHQPDGELLLMHAVRDALMQPHQQLELLELATSLSEELTALKEDHRAVVFTAAGNSGAQGWAEGGPFARSLLDAVGGHWSIGAVETASLAGPDAPRPWHASAPARVTMSAPGTEMPLGIDPESGAPTNVWGTSYATPLGLGLAAHVLATVFASHPDVTPDQLEAILRATATPIPGQEAVAGAGAASPKAITHARSVLDTMTAEMSRGPPSEKESLAARVEDLVRDYLASQGVTLAT